MSFLLSLRCHAVLLPSLNIAALAFAGSASAQQPNPVPLPGFRSIDGTNNNPFHPNWGAANTELIRKAACAYADGIGAPGGANLPSAREISNRVVAQTGSIENTRSASDFVWQWGQFLDHDLDLTGAAAPSEAFDIRVPTGDPFFDPLGTGLATIGLSRSHFVMSGTPLLRQQINEITAYIDASNVYGSDLPRSLELRMLDGSGRLKTSAGNLLPFNVNGFPNAPTPNDPSFFLAGDVRSNEQVALTAMHTLFVREHNTWATIFGFLLPGSSDEQRYQLARLIVAAEIQVITYEEFLPALLGPGALAPYTGYHPNVDPSIATEFATASYRFGHSMLSPVLQRLDWQWNEIPAGNLPLQQAFFSPSQIIANGGIEPILRGLSRQKAQEVDTMIVDDVRNFLFGPPGAGGFDLASLNIQRGRDHGLPGYNALRQAYGLPPKTSFAEVNADPAVQMRLASVYPSVDDIEPWVGGLAEDHLPNALVGELLRAVLADQFERLRDGDRFWFQIYLPPLLRGIIEHQTLADVIRRNTSIRRISNDVFHTR